MAQRPRATYQEIYTWFWGETALASLLRSVRDRLKASGNAAHDQLAFGIAR
jgi:hypothetical protein